MPIVSKVDINEVPDLYRQRFAEAEKTGERLDIPQLNIKDLAKDEEFKKLSPEAKNLIIEGIDPEYKSLSNEAKWEVLNAPDFGVGYKPKFIETPEGKLLTKEQYEQYVKSQGKQSFLKFLEEVPEQAGGLVGGLLGIPGGVPGMVGGAALGGAGAKAAQQLINRGFGLEAPGTATEAAKEIGLAGGKQALYEAGGQIGARVVGKVIAPFAKTVSPEARIAAQTLEQYMPTEKLHLLRPASWFTKQKVSGLLPAEATENRALDLLSNIAEGSFIGGKRIADFKDITRVKATENMVDDLISMFGERAEADMVGDAFVASVERNIEPSRLAAKVLYNSVDDIAKTLYKTVEVKRKVPTGLFDSAGKQIEREITETVREELFPTKQLKEFAKPLALKAKELGGIEAANAGDDLVRAIMDLPDTVSFSTMQELRSRLISKIDEFSVINKKAPAIGKAKKMTALTDEIIGKTLSKESPEGLAIWRQANKLYRTGNEQFNNTFIRRLVKEATDKGNPEVIAQKIFKTGAISNIRRTKIAVDPQTFKQLKSIYVQDLVRTSSKEEGNIVGQTLYNKLYGKTGMGEKTLREIFNPEEFNALKNTVTTLQTIQKASPSGTGKMWIQLTQAGAVVGLFDERTRPYAMTVIGGPLVLSRLMTNPRFAKLLTEGYTLPARSPQLLSVVGRISALAHQTEKEMKRNREMPYTQEELKGFGSISTLK